MRTAFIILAFAASAPALAAASKPAPEQPGADKDKLICRREVPIGSLIATRKICLTKAQWTRREEDGNREARKVVEDGASRQVSN
jgi:hypothetical protein